MSNSMLPISDGLKTLYGESTMRSDPRKAAAVTVRLFDRFKTLYGARWTEAGNDPHKWTGELGDFPVEAIAHGVVQSEKRYAEWPPNLAVFKSLCREYVPPIEARIARDRSLVDQAQPAKGDGPLARKYKPIALAILGLPGGDEKARQELIASPQYAAFLRGHGVKR